MQAAMIAGLLAKNHNKRVSLYINKSVAFSLSRAISLSFDCSIRPQTWNALASALKETMPIISSIGGNRALARVNPLILCNGKSGARALSHMYHLLRGEEYEIERLTGRDYQSFSAAYRVRGAHAVRPEILWPELMNWLDFVGVSIIDPEDLTVSYKRDGSAKLKTNYEETEVDSLILADEQSILKFGDKNDIDHLFDRCQTTTIITEPTIKAGEQLILNPEHRFCAMLKTHGGYEVIADVQLDYLGVLMGECVDNNARFRLFGRTIFNSLKPKDGAPIIGRTRRSGPLMIGGFGNWGVFFCPAIARFICNKSTDNEQQYFLLHPANSKRKSHNIADYRSFMERQG